MLRLSLTMVAAGMLVLTGCRTMDSQQVSKQAAALKQAHDAGVLTDAEYKQKLGALQQPRPAASAAAPRSGGSAASAKGNTWHMKRVSYRQNTSLDAMPKWGTPGRQGKDVDALAMLIPLDWTFQAGQNIAQYDCNMTSGRVLAVAMSPDKTAGLAIIPGKATLWSNDRILLQSIQQTNHQFQKHRNCVIQQPQPLAQVMAEFVKSGGDKNTQVAGPMEPVPGLSDKLPGMLEQVNRSLAQQGAHLEATAGRLPLKGVEGGVPTVGYLSMLQVVKTEQLPSGGTVVTTDYPIQLNTFGPADKYAGMEPMFNAMLDSVVIDPDFAAMCAQVSSNVLSIDQQTMQKLQRIQAEINEDNANSARQRAQIRSGLQAYSAQVHSSVAANRSAALDHSSQQFALHMGDQAIYKDPSTGARVQMSSQYSHAWASGNGKEYILSDSPSFNPNGQVGSGSWTQLQQER